MRFGIYVHIPYCLQICPYCDFSKYELGQIMPPENYVQLLAKEIRARAKDVPFRKTSTVYFGGGTPSLLDATLILTILEELAKEGFEIDADAEITLEINPGTIDQQKLKAYQDIGINRFSVGAQTFNDRLLKVAGRKHSSQETVDTLMLLKAGGVNYSFDLLFALPSQTPEEVRADVRTAIAFSPSHLSAYCLTVPQFHPMMKGRASETQQVEMFDVIERELSAVGILKYEVSNFARPGFESRHNTLYWTDQPYWGIGVSSHSYFPSASNETWRTAAPWGFRFWNPHGIQQYEQQLQVPAETPADSRCAFPTREFTFLDSLPEKQFEVLKKHEALTDFCHTSLRFVRGMDTNAARLKFGDPAYAFLELRLKQLVRDGLLEATPDGFALTAHGRLIADVAFEKLTFLNGDLDSDLLGS